MNAQPDPFAAASAVRPLGDGSFVAELHPDWAVHDRPHGGYLISVLSRAAVYACGSSSWNGSPQNPSPDPLSVSAHFLRSPKVGPVLIRTELLKEGRTVTVLRAVLEQRGRVCVDATIGLGSIKDERVAWSDLPRMPVNPPADAIDLGSTKGVKFAPLSQVCDLRLDPNGAGFLSGSTAEPLRLRLWVKPRAAQPDLLFSLVAGDIAVPVTFNLGRFGWSPTVQLTALLRAKPANGWLRLMIESKAVHGPWFDEDALVVDSTGRLVCQARQLALSDG